MSSQTFPKSERLYQQKVIQELFKKGSSLFVFPFKVLYLTQPTPQERFPAVLVSVAKKNFKKAHDRNRLKRQIKEAYRLQKAHFFHQPRPITAIALIFVGKEHQKYEFLQRKLAQVLQQLPQ
jgi:ribonuclease P protein component